jgi:hypothetical protein
VTDQGAEAIELADAIKLAAIIDDLDITETTGVPKTAERTPTAAAFRDGERRGADPVNTVVTSGPAITTRFSDWSGKYCRRCFHNFRPEDPVVVRLDADGKIAGVLHDDRLVSWCGRDLAAEVGQSAASREFFEAIDEENPPITEHSRRLHPGDTLLQVRETTRDKDRRARCFVCADSFRPFEFAVTCVCCPDDPQGCELTAHQDPGHAKSCFENWRLNIGRHMLKCPMDLRSLGGRG